MNASEPAETKSSTQPATAGPKSSPEPNASTPSAAASSTSLAALAFELPVRDADAVADTASFEAAAADDDAAVEDLEDALLVVLFLTSVFRFVPLPVRELDVPAAAELLELDFDALPSSCASGVMDDSSAVTVIS